MTTIAYPQKGEPGKAQASTEDNQENVHPYPHEINITEGSEFLDDAIRVKDQPFGQKTLKEDN